MSAADLAAFLAMSPPRRVPADLQRSARRLGVPLFVALMGALFLVAGSVLAVWFFPWSYLEDGRLRAADAARAPGRVTAATDTNLRISKRRVRRYEFEFQAADGERVSGVCYTTGPAWSAGDEVEVAYRAEDPAVSCIAGARRSLGDGASALVLLFPLVGAGLIAWHLVSRRRIRALLEQGRIAEARVTAVEETRVRVNRRRVHRIALQLADARDEGALTVQTHLPDILDFARARKDSQQSVLVLYDPARRKRALLPEAL